MDMQNLDRSIERRATALLLAVWHHKISFLLIAGAVFIATFAAFLFMEPVYEGSTLLIAGQTNLEQPNDGPSRSPEANASLAHIAQSDEVVRKAVEMVGLDRIVSSQPNGTTSPLFWLRSLFSSQRVDLDRRHMAAVPWLPAVFKQINVRVEPNSDIIRIAVRNHDPVASAEFANAIAKSFIDRQIELFGRPGAAEFFFRQKQRFDDEFAKASEEFEQFARSTQTYSASDQRELLLKKLNDLSLALAYTRSAISEKTGQRQALGDQLKSLAPVARSPYVSALVDDLSGGDRKSQPPQQPKALEERSADPPLLLVRVYQDSMVELFKVNADLSGARGREAQQTEEIAAITEELNRLSINEKEFARLERAVKEAAANSDLYSRRMVEEQIAAESNAAKFSSVKVLQSATVPFRPVFPNYWLVLALAIFLSLTSGILGATMMAYLRRQGQVDTEEEYWGTSPVQHFSPRFQTGIDDLPQASDHAGSSLHRL